MSIDLLFLNNKAMEAVGVNQMDLAIADVKEAYMLDKHGDVINPGKCVLRWGKTIEDENVLGRINAMPGYIGGTYHMAGIKWIGSGPMNYKKSLPRASVTIILNDPDTKLPVCIADGTAISTVRTGASGGVAIELLAKSNASVMTICGAGAQAHTQLEAAVIARPTINTVYVYDIRMENADRFISINKERYPQIKFIATADVEAATKQSDIIDCVTLATEPFIKGAWLKKGALVMNMSDYEVDSECVIRADKVVVDFWESVKHRMISTVALMWKSGAFKDEDIHAELSDILLGLKTPRENDDEIIYFNAVGAGILDIAVATRCYKAALEKGKGVCVPFWE
ncbi:MAG: ornithine cyclodeaminase family protein [Clostridia bacterium]|nr:ornithine cyclodeaminase family protein [Clostridia bacterium]MBQ7089953.1 ornithine cyclodeaminase family protein [Clostridia bacterium]